MAQVQGPKTAGKALKRLRMPDFSGQEKSWVVRGAPGDKFKIEFFQQALLNLLERVETA